MRLPSRDTMVAIGKVAVPLVIGLLAGTGGTMVANKAPETPGPVVGTTQCPPALPCPSCIVTCPKLPVIPACPRAPDLYFEGVKMAPK